MASTSPVDVITLSDTPECAAQLLKAAQTLGFVYVNLDNTGINPEQIDTMFKLSREFFALPDDVKEKYPISADNKGWSGMYSETLDPETQKRGDYKQAFNMGEFRSGKPQQPLPPPLNAAESTLDEFSFLCHSLCRKLLSLFATALDIEAAAGGSSYFMPSHNPMLGPSGSILRMLYYPSTPTEYDASADIRAGAHSDYGSLTLLFQREGQSGLEILKKEGGWTPVPIVNNAICVNIGDLLSYWTAGLLKSTVHRVVGQSGSAERFSMVYFCHPVDSTELKAIPSQMVQERGERGANEGTVMTAKEHLEDRLAKTYGWKK